MIRFDMEKTQETGALIRSLMVWSSSYSASPCQCKSFSPILDNFNLFVNFRQCPDFVTGVESVFHGTPQGIGRLFMDW